MKVTKSGITRTVILTQRWAIKVPSVRYKGSRMWGFAQGVLANLSEKDWSSWPGVCPQKRCWLGGLIAVYPRCEPHGILTQPEHNDPWWRAISPGLPGCDAKLDNLGLLDGQLVWTDFASPWNGCPEHGTHMVPSLPSGEQQPSPTLARPTDVGG